MKVFEFEILTLWDKPDQIRYDGIFGNFWHKRMFRLKDKSDDLFGDEPAYPDSAYIVLSVYHDGIQDIKAFVWNEQQSDFTPISLIGVGDVV